MPHRIDACCDSHAAGGHYHLVALNSRNARECTSSPAADRVRSNDAEWLRCVQNPDGGWGETVGSYDDPHLRGQGASTPSQTAWAVLGLLAAGDTRSDAVERGVEYLIKTQKRDGSWDDDWYTGTGFPRVFYLKYHMYAEYFPLLALATYLKTKSRDGADREGFRA